MQILPDCAADCAWDSDVMLQSAPAFLYHARNDVADHGARFGAQQSMRIDLPARGAVSDHHTAESTVADEYVRAQSEDEPWNTGDARGSNRGGEIVGRCCNVQEVGRASDTKSRERSE